MDKKKLILYFGLAGILPVIFFKGRGYFMGLDTPEDVGYFTTLIKNIMISSGITMAISSTVVFLPLSWFEKVLPWNRGIWKRLFADLLITPIVAVSAMVLLYYPLDYLGISKLDRPTTLGDYIEIVLIMNLILVAVYEGTFLFQQWKQSLVQSERLEKENMITKFEALKNQVNPHFLFNSLNTLSSLIHEDVQKSEEFIDEFSKIYRYILEKQERMVATLSEEIEFIKSYLHLQKVRFGDALVTEIKIPQENLGHFIPTLSLQLLVENAIKHNQVTTKQPLAICIQVEGNQVVVRNTYQPRTEGLPSTGIGLKNLRERYALLCDEKHPEFYIEENAYLAKIPLIEME